MITLKSVTYANIMSVGNHPITIQLDRNHTTLIGGQNGTGKSTALLALVYGLYGKLLNNMKLEQAVNSTNKKALLVKVEFEKNGEQWLVVRGEKPKKFEIYKNDELLDQYANSRDQQAFLELVLGMDFKLFTQLVAINKERYIPFMEMGAGDRRKIVEDILNISVFSKMNELLSQDMKDSNRLTSTLNSQRSVLNTKLEGIQNLINQLQISIKESNDTLDEEIENKMDELEAIQTQIDELASKLDDSINSQLREVQSQLREYEKIGSDFEASISSYKKEYSFFEKNDTCPTCEQSITAELKEQKRKVAEDGIKEIESATIEMLELVQSISDKHDELSAKQSVNESLNREINTLKTKKTYEQNALKALIKKKKELESSNDQKVLEEQIELYDEVEKEKHQIESDLEALMQASELQDQMKDLLKDDGVKALIVKDYNAIMNKKINEYLNAMGFFVNMTIDENFNEKFHSMNKESFSYANLSTGQKTRLNLAITLALLEVASVKNSAVCNVMWLDELLENLDAEGVCDAMNLFKEKLFAKNIFVVSQRYDEFIDMFHSSIRFRLNNGFTELAA